MTARRVASLVLLAAVAVVAAPACKTISYARRPAFGIDFAFEGGSGFANPFAWSA